MPSPASAGGGGFLSCSLCGGREPSGVEARPPTDSALTGEWIAQREKIRPTGETPAVRHEKTDAGAPKFLTIERVFVYAFHALPGRLRGPMEQLAVDNTIVQPDSCRDDELESAMRERGATITSQQRDLLRFVREHDSRKLWQKDGCRNMAQWLAPRFDISVAEGMRWTHAAHALEHLPLISAAFERGAIGLDKVLQLARFATAHTERELLRYARRASLNALRRRADLETRPPLEDHTDNHHARFLEWRKINDAGAIYMEGLFPAEEGAIVTKALRRIADRLPDMPPLEQKVDPQDTPDWVELDDAVLAAETIEVRDGLPQKLADALVALASGRIGGDSDADRATVVVSTTLEALQSDEHGCEIEGAGVVHPEIARRIACDCRLQFVLRNADDVTVGLGRTTRNISASLRRELMHRDGGCTFPGCGARQHLQAHHIWHWEAGGPTDLDNLTLVCHFHHKLLHEHRWMVHLDERQRARWFRPNGSRYDPARERLAA